MSNRGNGRNNHDLRGGGGGGGRGRGRGLGLGLGRGRSPGYRLNVKDDGVQDSNCRISGNPPHEVSIDDGSTDGHYSYRRSQHGQISPKREVNSSSKCTQSAIAPTAKRTQQDFRSPNRAVSLSSRQKNNSSLIYSSNDKERHAHSTIRPGSSQTPQLSQQQWVRKDISPNTETAQWDCTSPTISVGSSSRQLKVSMLVDSPDLLVDSADDKDSAQPSIGPRSSQTPQLSQHQSVCKDGSPGTERAWHDCTSPNRVVGSSSSQPKNSSLVDSADDKEWHAHSNILPRSSPTLHSQHQSFSQHAIEVKFSLNMILLPPPNLASTTKRDLPILVEKTIHEKMSSEKAADHLRTENSELLPIQPFDICQSKSGYPFALKPPLIAINKEKRKEQQCIERSEKLNLGPGMVLLKKYISHGNQIKIIKKCRELGLGPGGFYQPGFREGAKLHLQMMCLGKDWNPEMRSYSDRRLIDDACPPSIPVDFKHMVEEAIQESLAFIKQDSKLSNVKDVLPVMSPDICIVNFYTESGKLGLHQDRDESPESLRRGLPVVSFSIGDSAEFLYGENRDTEMAKRVILESGDVLIFGGESRHIFHGVPSIMRNSAPSFLLEETNLRPGRLNLTFRKF